MGSRLTHTAGFWLWFMKLGRDARVTLNLWSAPVRSNRRSQKGVERLQKNPPSHHRKSLLFHWTAGRHPLVHYGSCTAGRGDTDLRTKPPMLSKDPAIFFQDRAVKFWVLDKFQCKHNVLICTALTVAVRHTCISLRPDQLFSAVWIVALLFINLDKSVSALSTGCFNHYIL